MSTSAHERQCWQSNCAARDIANSLFQKWAIKGFFPESPCRWLSFAHFSFATEKKCERPIGLQALPPRRSRRVKPHRGQGYAPAGAPKGFPLALWKPSGRSWRKTQRDINIPAKSRVAFLGANNRHFNPLPPKAQGPPFPGDPCAFFISLQLFPFSSVPIAPRPPSSIP